MPLIHELSLFVSRRIEEMGLTPVRLAELARVPLNTVEVLLGAKDRCIDVADAERIANAVGLSLGVFGHFRSKAEDFPVFGFAAQSASTSLRDVLPESVLRAMLTTGQVSSEYTAHIRILLDEVPEGLLGRLADQIFRESGTSQRTTWKIMRRVARELACSRPLWQ